MSIARAMSLLLLAACTRAAHGNAYEKATSSDVASFKQVRIPLPSGVSFIISQGAFGKNSHDEKGNEYQWDFDVPYGTEVVAAASGRVLAVWEPHEGGGCDPKFSGAAHNIKVVHDDGTVAQYVHVES